MAAFSPDQFVNWFNTTRDQSTTPTQNADALANVFGGYVVNDTTTGIGGPGRNDNSIVIPGSGEKLDANLVNQQLQYATRGRYNADTGNYDPEPLSQSLAVIFGDAYRPSPGASQDDWQASGAMNQSMAGQAGQGHAVELPTDGGPGGGGTLRGGQSALPPGENRSEGSTAYWPAAGGSGGSTGSGAQGSGGGSTGTGSGSAGVGTGSGSAGGTGGTGNTGGTGGTGGSSGTGTGSPRPDPLARMSMPQRSVMSAVKGITNSVGNQQQQPSDYIAYRKANSRPVYDPAAMYQRPSLMLRNRVNGQTV